MFRDKCTSKSGQLAQIEESQVKDHLDKMVRGTVEERVNALLDAEAVLLVNAKRSHEEGDVERPTPASPQPLARQLCPP